MLLVVYADTIYFETPALDASRYVLVIVDRNTGYTVTYNLKHRSEVTNSFHPEKNYLSLSFDCKALSTIDKNPLSGLFAFFTTP